ncbi:LCP family protein [Micromonospora inositola]|uniref:Transcriptional attenuator, LytR family n=1 Tax=Micromonospora inositola TaxID=47865 RepID=A0A1C5GY45_9ACTN|nr:LCP family protein [Micromonospora inositola]SCG38706.1 transcriptional attenuator, LytR family [Micromonospora inositola]
MSRRHQFADYETRYPASEVDLDATEQTSSPAPRRRRGRRIALIVLLVLVLLTGGGLLAGGLYYRSINSSVERVDAFDGVPEESRPQVEVAAKGAMNIMMLGSDSRDPENTGGSRSDTIIVAHLPADRSSAQLISIPRDTWVSVPRSKDGQHGGRDAKINAAYAWGGVPLMVQTVEQFTGVRIDHVTMVDFSGFKEIVDALGGVEIDVEKDFTTNYSLSGSRTFVKGRQTMDGAAALDYARERHAFADGDFARIRHQQQVIKAILDKAASGGVLASPGKLNSFVKATSNAVAVDKSLSLLDLAMELRGLRGGNLGFFTCPVKGTGRVGSESVVFANTTKAKTLFDAVRRDSVPDILAAGK